MSFSNDDSKPTSDVDSTVSKAIAILLNAGKSTASSCGVH